MNMLNKKIGVAAALVFGMLVCGIASATPNIMDFDGLTPGTSVDTYYDGGCTTTGLFVQHNVDCGGPSDGVVWKGAKVRDFGDINEPSEPNFMGLGLLSTHATMNVATGFDTGLSFYYTTLVSGGIKVFSGLDGQGTILADMHLPFPGIQCGDVPCWDFVDLAFSGTAKSAVFYGISASIGFDDVTPGAGSPAPVPEPAALGMFGLGLMLIGLFVGMRRRQYQN